MAEKFPKPTKDSQCATNPKTHLCKTSENQKQNGNPLKRARDINLTRDKTNLYF